MKNISRKCIRFFGKTQKHSHKKYVWTIVPLCLILFLGCASHKEAQEVQNKAAVEEISTNDSELSQAVQTACDVLGEMHFEIEKADIVNGYIRTRPLAGAQFFEFWRNDNVGFKNLLLSNLHSIRRIVELKITWQTEKLNIDCKVLVQRLSIPQHEVTSSAQAYQMFTQSSISLQRLEMNPEQEAGMTWSNLNDDRKLEEEILKRINSTINRENKETGS